MAKVVCGYDFKKKTRKKHAAGVEHPKNLTFERPHFQLQGPGTTTGGRTEITYKTGQLEEPLFSAIHKALTASPPDSIGQTSGLDHQPTPTARTDTH